MAQARFASRWRTTRNVHAAFGTNVPRVVLRGRIDATFTYKSNLFIGAVRRRSDVAKLQSRDTSSRMVARRRRA